MIMKILLDETKVSDKGTYYLEDKKFTAKTKVNVVNPDNILAITFTNKAADEMKQRVFNMLSSDRLSSPWISTFHSFCLRLLRKHINELDYSREFIIYDASDQLSLIKQCMKSIDIDVKAFPPKAL